MYAYQVCKLQVTHIHKNNNWKIKNDGRAAGFPAGMENNNSAKENQ